MSWLQWVPFSADLIDDEHAYVNEFSKMGTAIDLGVSFDLMAREISDALKVDRRCRCAPENERKRQIAYRWKRSV